MQVHSISQQTARQGPTCKQRGPGLPQTPACLRPLCSGVGTQDKEKKAWYQLRPSHCQLPTIGPISPLLGDLTFLINTMNLSDHVVAKLVGSLIVQDLLSQHPAATSPSRLPSCLLFPCLLCVHVVEARSDPRPIPDKAFCPMRLRRTAPAGCRLHGLLVPISRSGLCRRTFLE